MFKYLILSSCLVALCRGFFNPTTQIYTLHNGGTVNFQGADLQSICRQAIMAMGGRPTDQLSDMMVTAVQNLQRIHGHNIAAITGKDPMWTCLASRAPGAMMANAVGDYFDTAVESLHRPINPFGYCNVGCGEAGINAAALGQNMQLLQGMMGGNKPTGQSPQTAQNTQGAPGTATTSAVARPAGTNLAANPPFNPFGGVSNPLAMNPMLTMMQQMMGSNNPWAAMMQGAGTGSGTAGATGANPPTVTGTGAPTVPNATATTNTGTTATANANPAPPQTMPTMPSMGNVMNPLAAMGNPFGAAGAATPGTSMQDFWRNAMVFGPDGLLQDGVTGDMGLGTAGASMARMSGLQGMLQGMGLGGGMPGMGGTSTGTGAGSTPASGAGTGFPFQMPAMGMSNPFALFG